MDRKTPTVKTGAIHQVRVIPLKKVVTERGYLMEVQRNDEQHFPGFGQAYITTTKPGVVKAWYRHHRQVDQIALVKGTLRLVLYDAREDSPTCQTLQELRITEDNPQLVQIPVGVWHGFQALDVEPTFLIHLNTIPLDFHNTDEDRLAADDPSIPYRWLE